jgi:DNA/RNA endonuclease YhcR with UshA esterase domain
MKKSIFPLLTVCLLLAGTGLAQTCPDIQGATGCAPSPLDGTPVSVTGIVYVVNGTYNSGSVYLNCGTPGNGGMTFFDSGVTVALGDEITVSGTVGAFGDEIQINGAVVTTNSSGNPVEPEVISTGDLADGTPNMGGFMEVSGLLEKVSDGFNSVYTVDDGSGPVLVFVDGTTGIDTAQVDLWLGDIVTVRGATKCFNGEGEVLPRSNDDFELLQVAAESESWGSIKSTYR